MQNAYAGRPGACEEEEGAFSTFAATLESHPPSSASPQFHSSCFFPKGRATWAPECKGQTKGCLLSRAETPMLPKQGGGWRGTGGSPGIRQLGQWPQPGPGALQLALWVAASSWAVEVSLCCGPSSRRMVAWEVSAAFKRSCWVSVMGSLGRDSSESFAAQVGRSRFLRQPPWAEHWGRGGRKHLLGILL